MDTKDVEKWNKATEEGDKQAQRELHTYTDEELAKELRQRGFEVWKWDRLPDWKENL